MTNREEIAATVLTPHFDAVRDVFVEYQPVNGTGLGKLRHTRLLVDSAMHDGGRHFAGCRQDGMLIKIAPEAIELPIETLVAILAHEFGHAADFAYPGRWATQRDQPATWIERDGGRRMRAWRKAWNERTDDQMEWDADSIAWCVTGRHIGYCGPCHLQCFGDHPRPTGLR
jgi:hypothetical protein